MSDSDLFEDVPCGLVITDSEDRVVRVNETFLRWTGHSREGVVGKDFHLLLDGPSRALYTTRYQAELWARSEMMEVALTLVRADGTPMPILMNAAMRMSEGRIVDIRLAIFDATRRQDYERQMLAAKRQAETSEASVRVLQEAATQFLASRTEAELGEAVSRVTREAFTAFDVAVVSYENGGTTFHVVIGPQLRDLLDAVRASRPPDPKALAADEVLLIANLDEAFARSEEVGRLFRLHRAEALAAVPIAAGDEVLGAFVCLFGRARTFDRAAIDLQFALARQAGLALARLRLQTELVALATRDQLTGLANRASLDDRLSRALGRAERRKEPMALIFVDLDGFKRINDELGHRVGDRVLQRVAKRMTVAVRDVDVVGRFGGDEFLVICEGAEAAAATTIADRLRGSIRKSLSFLPDGFGVTASVGIVVHSPGQSVPQTPDSLVRIADAAMYKSKRAGADRATLSMA